ncbi:hypothetical protein D3C72_1701280 [compost metagenome]
MLGRKDLQVGQAGHRAVVVHHFADHRGGRAAGHGGEVAAGFGVAGAHEHAAVHRLQREDVAGLHQVGGHGVACHGGLHGAGAVGGRDAGGHAFGRLDGDGEGGGMLGAVALDHRRQLQPLAHLAREREADQAARVAGHEVDGFGGDVVGGDDDVAFVLAVFLVHEDDHAASGQLGHDVFDRGDRCGCTVGARGADRRDGGVHFEVSLGDVEDVREGVSMPA